MSSFMISLLFTLGLMAISYLPWWPRTFSFDLKLFRQSLLINEAAFTIGVFLLGVPSFFVMLGAVACQLANQIASRAERRPCSEQ